VGSTGDLPLRVLSELSESRSRLTKTAGGNTGRFALGRRIFESHVSGGGYNSSVKQLVLDLIPTPRPSFDNFVPGRNREALTALARFSIASLSNSPIGAGFESGAPKIVYLWGVSGSGKTHLAQSAAANSHTLIASAAALGGALDQLTQPTFKNEVGFIVDNVERLSDVEQVGLFNLINLVSQPTYTGQVLVTGNTAPRDLPLRPELASRLGSGLAFQLVPLTELERADALRAHANARGFNLRADVIAYLLRHTRRDMASLMTFLDAIDQYSLETGREITLPLLREMSPRTLI
jgi:DnaA-homolog protein